MEKGGKDFSLPGKGLKTSLKSTPAKDASMKGKDDGSAKAKRGRKVQFDSGGFPEPRFDFLSNSNGSLGKGGKGDKIAHGGKIPMTKEPQPLELKIEQELQKNAKCMMDCEAGQILQGIQEQMALLSQDPTIKLPTSFDRGLQYAKKGVIYTNPLTVRRVLETLTKYGVTDGEICVIANIGPETVDEVFALVPSLKSKKSILKEPLKNALSELAKLKQSA